MTKGTASCGYVRCFPAPRKWSSLWRVQEAAKNLKSPPVVLNLEPRSLTDILDNIMSVGNAIGGQAEAGTLRQSLQQRIDAVRQKTENLSYRPRAFAMEWVDPPYCGGHWMKEVVEIAGGRDDLAVLHSPSRRIEWNKVLDFAPEVIALTCCGFNLRRSEQEGQILAQFEGLSDLPAAKAGRIFATDGSAYFSRPGPRIVESLEIMAHLIHPELFPAPPLVEAFSRLNLVPEKEARTPALEVRSS